MAFGAIGTVYLPITANAGSSLWGTDVRKVLSSADGASDDTTKTTHTIGVGVKRVTVDPYTSGGTADLTESDYGWAIQESDMGSVAGSLRRIPSGDHTITIRTGSNRDMAGANAGFHAFVWKVGVSPTFTRTLVQATDTGAFDYGPAGSVLTRACVLPSVPQIDLAAGETVMWGLELSCTGVALNSRICTHYTGTQGGVACKIDFPAIETLKTTTGACAATSTPTGVFAAQALGVGALPATVALSGSLASQVPTVAALPVAVALNGAFASQALTVGTLPVTVNLAASSALGTASIGTCAATCTLTGSFIAQATTVAALPVTVALSGAFSAQTFGVGSIAAAVTLAGDLTAQALTTGALATSVSFDGSFAASFGSVAALPIVVALDGVSALGTATTGSIASVVALNGVFAASFGAEGEIDVTVTLGATFVAGSGTTGAMACAVDLDGGDFAVGTGSVGTIEIGGGGGTTVVHPIFIFDD